MRFQNSVATMLMFLSLSVTSNVYAEPQDVPPSTESQRAKLLSEKHILDLQLEIAKRKAELARIDAGTSPKKPEIEKASKPKEVIVEEKVILVGVRGLDGNLTADLRIGSMPLTLQVGESYGDIKLKSLTPLCAKIARSGTVKTSCLTSLPVTTDTPSSLHMPTNTSPMAPFMPQVSPPPMPAPPAQLPGEDANEHFMTPPSPTEGQQNYGVMQ